MLLPAASKETTKAIGEQFECDPLFFLFQSVSIISGLLSVMSPSAQCSSSNRVCAVLRIPSCLLPSDGSSLAWPQSSACTHSINGIVRKQRGLYILTWMDAWGSFHFGWQGYSVCACLFPGFARVLCEQQLCSTDWSWRIVINCSFLEAVTEYLFRNVFPASYMDAHCYCITNLWFKDNQKLFGLSINHFTHFLLQ